MVRAQPFVLVIGFVEFELKLLVERNYVMGPRGSGWRHILAPATVTIGMAPGSPAPSSSGRVRSMSVRRVILRGRRFPCIGWAAARFSLGCLHFRASLAITKVPNGQVYRERCGNIPPGSQGLPRSSRQGERSSRPRRLAEACRGMGQTSQGRRASPPILSKGQFDKSDKERRGARRFTLAGFSK